MTTATLPKAARGPGRGPARRPRLRHQGRHFEDHIEGRYRVIPASQLAHVWWLFSAGHINKLELRIWFALQEAVERRQYGRTRNTREKPVFTIDEIQRLVGGRGNVRSTRKQQAALRHLGEIGLVTVSKHSIVFAKSTDIAAVGEGRSTGFQGFLDAIPNNARTVPVPRRLLRALAAGFSKGDTAYVIAFLLHAVFWHRDVKRYTVDGRMKLAKTSRLFGLSPRAFTDARARLIDLGWIKPLEVPWYLANRYGVHDVVNVHWSPTCGDKVAANDAAAVDNPTAMGEGSDTGSASPNPGFDTGSASPDLTGSLPTEIENTRRPTQTAGTNGVSQTKDRKKAAPELGPVTMHDIKPKDLEDTERLFELHRQFVAKGLAHAGKAGEMDFLSLANRARARGRNPGGMLRRLLELGKTEWITISDEEQASKRMREHLNGPDKRDPQTAWRYSASGGARIQKRNLSEDQLFVERCIQTARKCRVHPSRVSARMKQWTREQWNLAELDYRSAQARDQQWYGPDDAAPQTLGEIFA